MSQRIPIILFLGLFLIIPVFADDCSWTVDITDSGSEGYVQINLGPPSQHVKFGWLEVGGGLKGWGGLWDDGSGEDPLFSCFAMNKPHTTLMTVTVTKYTNNTIFWQTQGIGACNTQGTITGTYTYLNCATKGGWNYEYEPCINPTPTPTPTPSWLTANTSICHHAIIEGQPPSGTNFSYHATLYFFGTSIGSKIQEFWTTRDPFYWDFSGAPGSKYYIEVEATGTETHTANGTFTVRACSNLSPNGTLVPGITPTGGWPTYGPTQPRPGYTTMPTGTQPSGAPTSGPTLNPLPVIPTTMIPIWDVTVPVPIRTPGFWSTPEDQPINPIDTIITIIDDIINFFENLPDNLWDIFNYPDRDDLLNLVNSTLIPDSILKDYFDFWDQILNPIIEALHFILGILEIPLELLNTVLEYLKEILEGVFNEIINILKGAEFFFKWIFYVIPEPLLWIGLALMVLILIMKVLHS